MYLNRVRKGVVSAYDHQKPTVPGAILLIIDEMEIGAFVQFPRVHAFLHYYLAT
jgi:hypothetical protein